MTHADSSVLIQIDSWFEQLPWEPNQIDCDPKCQGGGVKTSTKDQLRAISSLVCSPGASFTVYLEAGNYTELAVDETPYLD